MYLINKMSLILPFDYNGCLDYKDLRVRIGAWRSGSDSFESVTIKELDSKLVIHSDVNHFECRPGAQTIVPKKITSKIYQDDIKELIDDIVLYTYCASESDSEYSSDGDNDYVRLRFAKYEPFYEFIYDERERGSVDVKYNVRVNFKS